MSGHRKIVLSTAVIGFVVVAVVTVYVFEEARIRRDPVLTEMMTIRSYKELVEMIQDAEGEMGPAPVRSSELLQWLSDYHGPPGVTSASFHPSVDLENGRLIDNWSNEVVVLAKDGRFWALGSRGRNGVWNNGGGDDIVVARGPELPPGLLERLSEIYRKDP